MTALGSFDLPAERERMTDLGHVSLASRRSANGQSTANFPRNPTLGFVYDCFFWARVASYHLSSDGKVDRVIFLENGAYWSPRKTRVALLYDVYFRPIANIG